MVHMPEEETLAEEKIMDVRPPESVSAPSAASAAPVAPAGPAPQPPQDILADPDDDYQESDVFAWANNLFEYKEDLQFELFWINKNNVVYRTKTAPELDKQLQPLFLDN